MNKLDEAKARLGTAMVDEIGKIVSDRRAKGRAEGEAISLLLACKREGHSRNPDGKCVRCHDVAEEPGYEST
jgi:hypothetical protein